MNRWFIWSNHSLAHCLSKPPSCREQAQPAVLDHGAAVHDHRDPALLRPTGRVLIDHAQLHPNGFGAQSNGLIDEGAGVGAVAEHIHHFQRCRVRQARDDGSAVQTSGRRRPD